jgi:hypothetical protein
MATESEGKGNRAPLVCPTAPTVECTLERVNIPWGDNICYLAEKAQFGYLFPKVSVRADGDKYDLKQIAMALAIIKEEKEHYYNWSYKAEVRFAIRGKESVPIPMLSTSQSNREKYGYINRPHSSNWLASPTKEQRVAMGVTAMRRPDIILVKDKKIRWPGRAATYFDGQDYPDNLKLLIEVKYPPDTLKKGQERDYTLIATRERFGVLVVRAKKRNDDTDEQTLQQKLVPQAHSTNVSDPITVGEPVDILIPAAGQKPVELPPNRKPGAKPDEEGEEDEPNVVPFPDKKPQPDSESLPEPEEGPIPIAAKVQVDLDMPLYTEASGETHIWQGIPQYEYWVLLMEDVSSLTADGYNYVSDVMLEMLKKSGDWLTQKGEWLYSELIDPVTQEIKRTYRWISEVTGAVIEFTESQLKGMWQLVEDATEWTVETLADIDWIQILTDLKNGFVEVIVAIGTAIVVVVCTIVVVEAIIALVAMLAAIAAAVVAIEIGAAIAAFFTMLTGTLFLSSQT